MLLARQAVGDAADELRRVVSRSARSALWQESLVPTDQPGLELVHLDVDSAVETAREARPELEQLRIGIRQARLGTAFQKNQRLPELNLLAEYGFSALDTKSGGANDDIFGGDNPHWLVGFEFRVPWGNRTARGQYERALATQRETETDLVRTEQRIVQDVRGAVREAATALRRIDTTRAALRLAEEQLQAELAKLDVGVSMPFDVLQRQDDRVEAENRALQAQVAYRVAVANLARAKGRYLERIGLALSLDSERNASAGFAKEEADVSEEPSSEN